MARIEFKDPYASYLQPNWAAEPIGPQNMIPGGAQIDADQFPYSGAFQVRVTGAVAAGNGVTIPVQALDGDLPNAYILNFGGKYATLTASAVAGATQITANLSAALTGTETAQYMGRGSTKFIKAGTFVGRTWAERDAGVPLGVYQTGDTEYYLLAFDVVDAITNPECELLQANTMVRDHLLPGWDDLPSTTKTVIRQKYQCVRGATEI